MQNLEDVTSELQLLGKKLYIIINEYNNFANTILATSGQQKYMALTHGESFFKTFFNYLKAGTTGSGASVSRLSISGVSPLTLDDVTSDFNIGENISIFAQFNSIIGFTAEEVRTLLNYYKNAGLLKQDIDTIFDLMQE